MRRFAYSLLFFALAVSVCGGAWGQDHEGVINPLVEWNRDKARELGVAPEDMVDALDVFNEFNCDKDCKSRCGSGDWYCKTIRGNDGTSWKKCKCKKPPRKSRSTMPKSSIFTFRCSKDCESFCRSEGKNYWKCRDKGVSSNNAHGVHQPRSTRPSADGKDNCQCSNKPFSFSKNKKSPTSKTIILVLDNDKLEEKTITPSDVFQYTGFAPEQTVEDELLPSREITKKEGVIKCKERDGEYTTYQFAIFADDDCSYDDEDKGCRLIHGEHDVATGKTLFRFIDKAKIETIGVAGIASIHEVRDPIDGKMLSKNSYARDLKAIYFCDPGDFRIDFKEGKLVSLISNSPLNLKSAKQDKTVTEPEKKSADAKNIDEEPTFLTPIFVIAVILIAIVIIFLYLRQKRKEGKEQRTFWAQTISKEDITKYRECRTMLMIAPNDVLSSGLIKKNFAKMTRNIEADGQRYSDSLRLLTEAKEFLEKWLSDGRSASIL